MRLLNGTKLLPKSMKNNSNQNNRTISENKKKSSTKEPKTCSKIMKKPNKKRETLLRQEINLRL